MRNWTLMAALLLAGVGVGCSDNDPSNPSPVTPAPTATPAPTPTPTPSASSAYAGSWIYRTTITAVDRNCGHTTSDIGLAEGPFAVTIASNGTFALPEGGQGAIDSGGTVRFAIDADNADCRAGTGLGGCRDTDHCDGTSEQTGDVKKWTLARQ